MEYCKFGFSMKQPPMFINHEFLHWKNFMITYLNSIDYDMGCLLEENVFNKLDEHLNAKTLTIIQEALVGSKYENLMFYECVKSLWNELNKLEDISNDEYSTQSNKEKFTCLMAFNRNREVDEKDGEILEHDNIEQNNNEVSPIINYSIELIEYEYDKLIGFSSKLINKYKRLTSENKSLELELERLRLKIEILENKKCPCLQKNEDDSLIRLTQTLNGNKKTESKYIKQDTKIRSLKCVKQQKTADKETDLHRVRKQGRCVRPCIRAAPDQKRRILFKPNHIMLRFNADYCQSKMFKKLKMTKTCSQTSNTFSKHKRNILPYYKPSRNVHGKRVKQKWVKIGRFTADNPGPMKHWVPNG